MVAAIRLLRCVMSKTCEINIFVDKTLNLLVDENTKRQLWRWVMSDTDESLFHIDGIAAGGHTHQDAVAHVAGIAVACADRVELWQIMSRHCFVHDETAGCQYHALTRKNILIRQPDVTDVMPDWNNDDLYWFVTREGHVATVDISHGTVTAGDIHLITLAGEEFLNSVAMDSNGMYAASDHAMYRFVRGSNDEPVQMWRQTYDRGTMLKPGQVNQGTGTTPTLMGAYDDLVAVTDNADSAINLVVYKRQADASGGANPAVCTIPLFNDLAQSNGNGTYKSATDNSPIGYHDSLIAGNTYGYTSPLSSDWAAPGLWRVDVVRNVANQPVGCTVAWKNNTSRQTAVSKLSVGNGLVYTYSREPISIGSPYELTRAYYFGAVNLSNGETAFKVLAGTGGNFNDNYSPLTLGPDGTAYIGVFAGILSVK